MSDPLEGIEVMQDAMLSTVLNLKMWIDIGGHCKKGARRRCSESAVDKGRQYEAAERQESQRVNGESSTKD